MSDPHYSIGNLDRVPFPFCLEEAIPDGDWRLPLGLFALMMGLLSEKCFVEATRNVRTAGASSLFSS